jgi:hypothetical protein
LPLLFLFVIPEGDLLLSLFLPLYAFLSFGAVLDRHCYKPHNTNNLQNNSPKTPAKSLSSPKPTQIQQNKPHPIAKEFHSIS